MAFQAFQYKWVSAETENERDGEKIKQNKRQALISV